MVRGDFSLMNRTTTPIEHDIWQQFAQSEQLEPTQLEHFKKYAALLQEWNKKINLTRIIDDKDIITHHFQDSLSIARVVDCKAIDTMCDVGAGGGFPGIPLKIRFPHLSVILIEVNHKKIVFLQEVINALQLKDVEICSYDWRTFLRKTTYSIDLFLVRASLKPDELIRMFQAGCRYRDARLVYWASAHWQSDDKTLLYIDRDEPYTIAGKKRRLIFFSNKES